MVCKTTLFAWDVVFEKICRAIVAEQKKISCLRPLGLAKAPNWLSKKQNKVFISINYKLISLTLYEMRVLHGAQAAKD